MHISKMCEIGIMSCKNLSTRLYCNKIYGSTEGLKSYNNKNQRDILSSTNLILFEQVISICII